MNEKQETLIIQEHFFFLLSYSKSLFLNKRINQQVACNLFK